MWDIVLEAVKVLIGPAVVSTAATLIVTHFKDKNGKKLDREQSVWMVSQTLEHYTVMCARMIDEVNRSIGQVKARQAEFPHDSGGLPDFWYPESIAWRAFKGTEFHRIQAFARSYDATKRYISLSLSRDEDDSLPGYLETLCAEAAKLGQEAWALAKEVRANHGLPAPRLHAHDSRALEVLKQELAEFNDREQRRVVEWQKLNALSPGPKASSAPLAT